MANICKNCGAQLPENGGFCAACGTPAENNAQPQYAPAQPVYNVQPAYSAQPQYVQPGYGVQPQYGQQPGFGAVPPAPPKKKKTGLIIGIVIAVVALIVIVIIAISSAATDVAEKEGVIESHKTPVIKIADAYENRDFTTLKEAYSDLFFEELDETLAELEIYNSDYLSGMETSFEGRYEYIEEECGVDFEVTYEIENVKEYDDEEILEYIEEVEEEGSTYDPDDIQELYSYDFVVVAEGEYGEIEIVEGTMYVVKSYGEWGLISLDGEWCDYSD